MQLNKKPGFTLIEVMIAITVFSIGVLAVLNLIVHNLSTIDKTQSQITATILAKEGIDLAYNIRNSNLQKGFAWDCILAKGVNVNDTFAPITEDVCASHFSSGTNGEAFQLAFDPGGYYVAKAVEYSGDLASLFTMNRLSYYTGNIAGRYLFWYGYADEQSDGIETPFARYLIFTGVKENGAILPLDSILKVESHVISQKGGNYNDTVLESFIGNF